MATEDAWLTRAERTQLAALLAAAIVASDTGEWENAAVAENAWDLLQAIEAEGAKRPQPTNDAHGETTGARGERESRR